MMAADLSGGSFVTVASMVVTSAGAVVASLFAWLSARDKLKYDATMVKMQSDIEQLQKDEGECRDQRDKDRENFARVEGELRKEIHELYARLRSGGGGRRNARPGSAYDADGDRPQGHVPPHDDHHGGGTQPDQRLPGPVRGDGED